MKRNPLFSGISQKYLFHEMKTRVEKYKAKNPEKSYISLGIGDTTEPLPSTISQEISRIGTLLGTIEGYRGYTPEQGIEELRRAIYTSSYSSFSMISEDDIFISDGAKCDIQRLQILFGQEVDIGIQDPSYPAYKDSSLVVRKNKPFSLSIESLEKDITNLPHNSVIFLCHPNNPTGSIFDFQQLSSIVNIALEKQHMIVFDVAYRDYIEGASHLRSIYEIPRADEVAIEVGSFSKSAGFSGIRLGWSIFPKKLRYNDGTSVQADFMRLITTTFNGASYISQKAGIAALTPEGREKTYQQVQFYKENISIIRQAFSGKKAQLFGGIHAPYLWVSSSLQNSWDVFEFFLDKAQLITTPGIGFGAFGDGFIRISGFGSRENIYEAARRIKELQF